jgi:hypothetical protein
MKTNIIFFTLLLSGYLSAQTITPLQAQEIMKNHFISLAEARTVYPDLPELTIPFTLSTLKNNHHSWLLPVKTTKGFKYLLIQANFINEAYALKKVEPLDIETTKEVLILLAKLRPNFPEREDNQEPFKYFFRTKDYSFTKENINFNKTISYNGNNFITINWPSDIEYGIINQNYVTYLRQIKFRQEPLPEGHPKVTDQSIFILTLFKHL